MVEGERPAGYEGYEELVSLDKKKKIRSLWFRKCSNLEPKESRECYLKVCSEVLGDYSEEELNELDEYCFPEVLI